MVSDVTKKGIEAQLKAEIRAETTKQQESLTATIISGSNPQVVGSSPTGSSTFK